MRYTVLLSLVIVLALLAAAPRVRAQAAAPDVIGVYLAEGVNPEGAPYMALLEIVQRGETFHARWSFQAGEPAYGVGFVRYGALIFGYPGGVVAYTLDDQGRISVGEWTVGNEERVFTETVTKLPEGHRPQSLPAPRQGIDSESRYLRI